MRAKCPYCKNIIQNYERHIVSPINKKRYNLYNCDKCYLTFYTPLVFEDIYEKGDFYNNRHNKNITISNWTMYMLEQIKKNNIQVNNKKILDIGASNGVNYYTLQKEFKIKTQDYYALELDKKALQTAKRIGVTNIIPHYFNKEILKKIKTKFDIIIATEVLEHQTDPKDFMTTAMKMLKKDGIFIITVPNKDRLFMKRRELPKDVPPHHFLKLSIKFFKHNYNNIVLLKTFYKRLSTTKSTAQTLSNKILKTKKTWPLFTPLVIPIRLIQTIDSIKGDRIIAIIKK